MATEVKDLFDEWSAGVQLANSSNDFFEEIPTELANPQNFEVKPEDLPVNPTETPVAPVPVQEAAPVEPEPGVGPEVRQGKRGGTVTLEKTSRGWRATIDPQISNLAPENFYAPNKDELVFSICEAKMDSNKAIHKLKKEKLLGGEDSSPAPVLPVKNVAKISTLSADDAWEIKNKLNSENPAEGFDAWVKKRFGLDPEEFAEALKAAPEARKIAEAQKVKGDIDEVNAEFIGNNPDYAEHYSSSDNAKVLVVRMAKAHLNRKLNKSTPQSTIDDTIFELYNKGFWTPENLETAKEELIDSGLLERSTPIRQVSEPNPPQPVAPTRGPSVPEAPRIAAKTGQPVGLGISAKTSSAAVVPEDKPLADVDLQSMPLDKLRALAAYQINLAKQGRQ